MGSGNRLKRGGASKKVKTVIGEIGERIGEGATSEVFRWGDDHIIKLFRPEYQHVVELEAERTRAVQQCGVPSPAIFQIEQVDGRRGIVFGFVEGQTLMSYVGDRGVQSVARALAEVHAALHQISGAGLPTLREQVESASWTDPAERDETLARIDQMPEGEVVCHGDLHPGNIVLSGDGPMIFDWVNATCAPAAADVARTLMLIGYQGMTAQTPDDIRAARREMVDGYLAEYLKITTVTREDVVRCEPAKAAALLRAEPDHFERDALEAIISD